VEAGADWTLFSPNEVPDLHDLYGKPFKAAYEAYEAKAARGEMKVFRTVKAVELWRRMLTMLFETAIPGSPSRTPATCAPRNAIPS
jgi:ribonucleoside-diphosphate reductase alpha chain